MIRALPGYELIAERHRLPHIGIRRDARRILQLACAWKLKSFGRDAGDRVALAVERECLSDYVRRARHSPLPKRVAYYRNASGPLLFVFICESASKFRRNAHQLEEVCGHARASDSLGFTIAAEIELRASKRRDLFEAGVLF